MDDQSDKLERLGIALVEIPPVGTQEIMALVCTSERGCGLRPVECNVYPEPEFNLQEYRRVRGLGLRQCAKLLGLRASEVSGLERGSLRPAGGWAAVVDVLVVAASKEHRNG